jgi:hypothetical protein
MPLTSTEAFISPNFRHKGCGRNNSPKMRQMKPAIRKSSHFGIKESNNSREALYRTPDLALSSFLAALGHEIIEVNSERGRGVFAFQDTQQLQNDLLAWCNGSPVSINVRAFVNGMRDLKGVVGAA